MVETLRAEWGVSLPDAMQRESIPATVVLWPALLARKGVEIGEPKHVESARLKAKARARAWLQLNYDIIPSPSRARRRRNSRLKPFLPPGVAEGGASDS